MTDVVFDPDTITASPNSDEVVAGPGAAAFDYTSSEQLILAGDSWPGQWDIDPSGCQRDVDKKKPKGKHGHTMRDNGLKGGMVKATGTLTESERALCNERIAKTVPTSDSGVKVPMTISHPDCNQVGISAVYVEMLKVRSPRTGKDFHTIEMQLGQWFPEPKDVKKPVPESLFSRDEANQIFQGLQQDPGPFGPDEDVPDNFADSVGQFADQTANNITSPEMAIPPYTEP